VAQKRDGVQMEDGAVIKTRPGGSHRGGGAFKAKVAKPGPGSHDIPVFPDASPVVPSSSSFTMAVGRNERTPRKTRAGPGAYYPKLDLTREKERCYGFGKSPRLLSEVSSERKGGGTGTPAPHLAHVDNHNFKKSAGFGFGTEEKFFRSFATSDHVGRGTKQPGPGEHSPLDHITSKVPPGPSYSMSSGRQKAREKDKQEAIAAGPGPGEYKPDDALKLSSREKASPRFGFGTTARLMGCQYKSRTPGPGSYSTSNTTRTGHSSVGGSAPKWSMAGRQELDVECV